MGRESDSVLLINADDFGISSDVNSGIVLAFKSSLVTSCTVMANAPAFEDACNLAHACGLAAFTGVHFVLDEGEPLTETLRRERRFCGPDGRLIPRKAGRLGWLSSTESEAVAVELRAQIARCRASGLGLTHLDSHHHIHEEMGVILAMLPVMREQGIRSVRPMRNLRHHRTLLRHTYSCAFNAYLRVRGVNRTRYFGSISDFLWFVGQHGRAPDGSVELMVHPTLGPNGEVVDSLEKSRLSEVIKATRLNRRSNALGQAGDEDG